MKGCLYPCNAYCDQWCWFLHNYLLWGLCHRVLNFEEARLDDTTCLWCLPETYLALKMVERVDNIVSLLVPFLDQREVQTEPVPALLLPAETQIAFCRVIHLCIWFFRYHLSSGSNQGEGQVQLVLLQLVLLPLEGCFETDQLTCLHK